MKELAAYLLLVLAGKDSIKAEDVSAVIAASGGEADADKLTALLADLNGKDIHELLAKGDNDLKSVVGAVASSAAPAAAAGAPAAAPAAAAKAEKPKEEEVDALDGGMDMFGGGGEKTGGY